MAVRLQRGKKDDSIAPMGINNYTTSSYCTAVVIERRYNND